MVLSSLYPSSSSGSASASASRDGREPRRENSGDQALCITNNHEEEQQGCRQRTFVQEYRQAVSAAECASALEKALKPPDDDEGPSSTTCPARHPKPLRCSTMKSNTNITSSTPTPSETRRGSPKRRHTHQTLSELLVPQEEVETDEDLAKKVRVRPVSICALQRLASGSRQKQQSPESPQENAPPTEPAEGDLKKNDGKRSGRQTPNLTVRSPQLNQLSSLAACYEPSLAARSRLRSASKRRAEARVGELPSVKLQGARSRAASCASSSDQLDRPESRLQNRGTDLLPEDSDSRHGSDSNSAPYQLRMANHPSTSGDELVPLTAAASASSKSAPRQLSVGVDGDAAVAMAPVERSSSKARTLSKDRQELKSPRGRRPKSGNPQDAATHRESRESRHLDRPRRPASKESCEVAPPTEPPVPLLRTPSRQDKQDDPHTSQKHRVAPPIEPPVQLLRTPSRQDKQDDPQTGQKPKGSSGSRESSEQLTRNNLKVLRDTSTASQYSITVVCPQRRVTGIRAPSNGTRSRPVSPSASPTQHQEVQ